MICLGRERDVTPISLAGYIGLYSEQRMYKSQSKALENLRDGKLVENIPCIKLINVGFISILITHIYVNCTLYSDVQCGIIGERSLIIFWQRNTKLRYSTGRKVGVGMNFILFLV